VNHGRSRFIQFLYVHAAACICYLFVHMLCYAMLCYVHSVWTMGYPWDTHCLFLFSLLCIHAKAVCRMSPNGDEKTGRAGRQAGPWMEALDLATEVRQLSSKTLFNIL